MTKRDSITDSGVPEQAWRPLHPLTPLSQTWTTFAAILGIFTYNSYDNLTAIFKEDVLWGPGYWGYSMLTVIIFGVLVIALLLTLLIGLYSWAAWRKMRFAITTEAVYFRSGIISRNQRIAKLNRIQAVNIVHPLFGRLFGLGRIDIEVAGGADSNVSFGLLKTAELEAVRLEILQHLRAAREGVVTGETQIVSEGVAGDSQLTEGLEQSPSSQKIEIDPVTGARTLSPEQAQTAYDTTAGLLNSESEGRLIFEVPIRRLLLAQCVNMRVIIAFFGAMIFIGGAAVLFIFTREIAALFSVGSVGVAFLTYLASAIASNFNFRAYLAEDGIRVRAGLTTTRAQTIAPQRIHSVTIDQPYFWRIFDWYRVRVGQAAFQGTESDKVDHSVLLPVGTREDMLRAVWMIFPDLGVADPIGTIKAGLEGFGDGNGYVNNPVRAKYLDWFTSRRNAHCLTEKVILARGGRINRDLEILAYSRLQSVELKQGPFSRKLNLASVEVKMVGTAGLLTNRSLTHLDPVVARQLYRDLQERANQQRTLENPASWNQRVNSGLEANTTFAPANLENNSTYLEESTAKVENMTVKELFAVNQLQFHPVSQKLTNQLLLKSVMVHLVFAAGFILGAVFGTPWLWIAVALVAVNLTVRVFIIPRQVRAYSYALGETDLYIHKGLFFKELITIPYGRMQSVSVTQGPVMRALGFVSINLETANNSQEAVPGVPFAQAHNLREYFSSRCDSEMIGL